MLQLYAESPIVAIDCYPEYMRSQIHSHTLHDMDHWFDVAKNTCSDYQWVKEDGQFQKFGFGECVSRETNTIEELQEWWEKLNSNSDVELTAFVSIAFDEESSWKCKATVPAYLFEKVGADCQITFFSSSPITMDVMGDLLAIMKASEPQAPGILEKVSQSLPDDSWQEAIEESLNLMESTPLEKIVLSRMISYKTNVEISPAEIMNKLREHYPQCWVFGFDGFVGATPEMLVEVHNNTVKARVLAGTQSRTNSDKPTLLESKKDLHEHDLAIKSLTDTLEPSSQDLTTQGPFTLELPNVWHLASDVEAKLSTPVPILELVKKLHPTAAVGGTPTELAVKLIKELEHYDRGPYSGPIGWMNSQGEGQIGIALRCGLVHGNSINLYAGCGIVPGSIPAKELAETEHKMEPMRQALSELFA